MHESLIYTHRWVCRVALIAAAAMLPGTGWAQGVIEVPAPSPEARVEQRFGMVPYDKVWRAGANAPTKLTVSRDFTFGGTAVKAGSYAVYVNPGKTTWAVALNTDLGNEWLRAQIQGNKAEATASANRALGKGNANFEQNVQPNIVKALADWK